MTINTFNNLSAIAQTIQDDAILVVREVALMPNLVTVLTDLTGGNTRTGYQYNSVTADTIAEVDDLTSSAFAPSVDQVLTPAEIGKQFLVTDLRASSELPEMWMTDAARELGLAAAAKIESDLVGDLASLTGGTVGASGSAITWGYLSAAIAQARNANESAVKPLVAVIHGYQAAVLAKTASVAGATLAQAPNFTDAMTSGGGSRVLFANFMGVPIYQSFQSPDSSTDFTGGVFPREALALDWRRMVRIETQRDASRRGTELNMSAVYAHGVWRPNRGVKMIFSAATPTS